MFSGSMVALVTPFKDGGVDWQSLEELVEFHIKNGTNGIVPCGTTGESATLSHQEHDDVIKAVVKTVFAGDRVEDFEAEIVGVLKGGRAEGDLILARATSERVVKSGVAQGMSGSPVYVEGRLVGALSTGWSYSREPLFGVTLIGEMLAVLDLPSRPDTPDSEGSAGPAGRPWRKPVLHPGGLLNQLSARRSPPDEGPEDGR